MLDGSLVTVYTKLWYFSDDATPPVCVVRARRHDAERRALSRRSMAQIRRGPARARDHERAPAEATDIARISPLAHAHVIPSGTYHFARATSDDAAPLSS